MRRRSPETSHDVEAAIDTLYEIPPDDFVDARGELVRRLRERGEREAAAGVKSLRKPSPSVWAVNQLARRGLLDALLEVSAELRDAQGGASTAGPEALRELSGRRRREVASLTEQAGAILRAAGLAAARTQLDRVSNTLQALTADEEGAERLREGRLEHDETPSGFAGSFPAVAPPSPAEEKRMADRDAARRREELGRVAEEAEREAERLAHLARAAEEEAVRARAAADAARGRAADARRALEESDGRKGGPAGTT